MYPNYFVVMISYTLVLVTGRMQDKNVTFVKVIFTDIKYAIAD